MTVRRALGILGVMLMLAGCGRSRSVTTTRTDADGQTTSTSTTVTTEDPVSAAQRDRLARLDAEIDSLGRRVQSADRRLQAGLEARLASLRARRDSTARALDALKSAGQEGLARARVQADTLLGRLEGSIERTRAGLRGRDTTPR